MSSDQHKVKVNTIYNLIKSITGVLFPLITFPYISRVLQAENLGKINFGQSIVSYVSLVASLGISTLAVRECSKVKADREKLGHVSSQIFSINLLATIVAYIGLVIALIFAVSLRQYRLLIIVQSISVLFTTFGADWLNTAMEDLRYVTIRTVLFHALAVVMMLLFVKKSGDYLIYAIIVVISNIGANVCNIFYRSRYCKVRFTFSIEWRKYLIPTFMVFSMLISQVIYCNSDITILGIYRGDIEVGLYGTSVKIYNIVNTFVASITAAVIPQITVCFQQKDEEKAKELLRYALGFIVTLGLPCIVGINIICKELITLFAGPSFVAATTSMHILTIALAASYLGGFVGNMILFPLGKEKICLIACMISAFLNVGLNLIFIPQNGFNAAALTTAISEIVGLGILLCFVGKNVIISKLWKIIEAPMLGSIAIILIGIICKKWIHNSSLCALVVIVLSVIVYFLVLVCLKNEFIYGFLNPILYRIKKWRDGL